MATVAPELEAVDVAPGTRPCDVHGCFRAARVALAFAGQAGHVHVCGPCEAIDREHCAVVRSWPLPCTECGPDSRVWVAIPTELT